MQDGNGNSPFDAVGFFRMLALMKDISEIDEKFDEIEREADPKDMITPSMLELTEYLSKICITFMDYAEIEKPTLADHAPLKDEISTIVNLYPDDSAAQQVLGTVLARMFALVVARRVKPEWSEWSDLGIAMTLAVKVIEDLSIMYNHGVPIKVDAIGDLMCRSVIEGATCNPECGLTHAAILTFIADCCGIEEKHLGAIELARRVIMMPPKDDR